MMIRASVVVVVVALAGVVSAAPGVTLAGHRPSWATHANDRGIAANQPLGHVTVHLARSAAKQQAFDALLEAQQTPGSPEYHHWLTPAQIGARFGASDADVAATTAWLQQQGFTVLRVGNAKTFIDVAGTTATASRALAVEFHQYAVGAKTRLSIDREPTIPARLASIVTSIGGLAQHDIAPQHVVGKGGFAHARPFTADGAGDFFVSPSDFSTIYDLGPAVTGGATGSGQVIGVIGRSRVLAADVTNFNSLLNANVPQPVIVVPPDGTDPGAACGDPSCGNGDQAEATLDVQRAGSIAPGAKLELIISGSSGAADGTDIAIEFAIDTFGMPSGGDANILNLSFGTCEAVAGTLATDRDNLYKQAAMQGQSVFVSAGDSGAAGCQADGAPQSIDQFHPADASVNVLGSSSFVTCLGGTKFADGSAESTYWDAKGSAISYIPEGAWNEWDIAGSATPLQLGGGGGESMYIAKPSYQMGLGSAASTHRLVPDLSFDSAEIEGYVVCIASFAIQDSKGNPVPTDCGSGSKFAFNAFGGTSAAAPDMAGVTALIDQKVGTSQGNINPILYMLAKDPTTMAFHDVTVASSGVASCTEAPSLCNNSDPGPMNATTGGTPGYLVADGYDEATGLGTPDISQLIAHWPGAMPPALTLDPTSLTVMTGHEGTVALETSNFLGPVTYACSNDLPSGATCAFANNELTISVPLPGAGAAGSSWPWLLLIPGGLALMTFLRGRGRRVAIVFSVLAGAAALSCGGNGQNNAQQVDAAAPVTATITITATAGTQSASAPLQLTVE